MQVVKDHFGTEVSIGDALIHVVKKSTSVSIHYSIVYGFIWRGDNNVQARVASVKTSWYKADEYRYYRASLTVNNFVKIPLDSIPEHIRNRLMDLIEV